MLSVPVFHTESKQAVFWGPLSIGGAVATALFASGVHFYYKRTIFWHSGYFEISHRLWDGIFHSNHL